MRSGRRESVAGEWVGSEKQRRETKGWDTRFK
jgi:hypothetical protein